MLYVLFSVFCSVTVSIILKLARRYAVDTRQIVVWNYPAAAALTFWFFKPHLLHVLHPGLPWAIYLPLAVLLPSVFLALSGSIRFTGIVRTEVAQRLSLVIPLLAAFWVFGEEASSASMVGVGIGLLAILCTIGWNRRSGTGKKKSRAGAWLYPALVFVGYGVCDVLFKAIAQFTAVPYTTSIFFVFVLAMFFAFIYLAYWRFAQHKPISVKAFFWGILLGGFNFANILFYMKAHRALPDNPSIVFTGMNIGVITVGALVGVVVFKEKLSTLNVVGLFLAMVSVAVLAYSLY